ncbi:MAG: hypothetical protein Fur0012_13780 [Elusimicrobiota bacterium]
MFDKMKDILALKKKAEELKKELDSLRFSSEDKISKVEVNASMEILSVEIRDTSDRSGLEKSIKENVNKALKNARAEAAKKAMSMGLGF